MAKRSSGTKRLPDSVGIGGGDSQEGLGGSAWTAGVLLPFVEGADAHANELGELGLAEAHGTADGDGIGIVGIS